MQLVQVEVVRLQQLQRLFQFLASAGLVPQLGLAGQEIAARVRRPPARSPSSSRTGPSRRPGPRRSSSRLGPGRNAALRAPAGRSGSGPGRETQPPTASVPCVPARGGAAPPRAPLRSGRPLRAGQPPIHAQRQAARRSADGFQERSSLHRLLLFLPSWVRMEANCHASIHASVWIWRGRKVEGQQNNANLVANLSQTSSRASSVFLPSDSTSESRRLARRMVRFSATAGTPPKRTNPAGLPGGWFGFPLRPGTPPKARIPPACPADGSVFRYGRHSAQGTNPAGLPGGWFGFPLRQALRPTHESRRLARRMVRFSATAALRPRHESRRLARREWLSL